MKILTIENDLEYLRQISKDIDFNDEELKQNIIELKKYCSDKKIFALAGVQLGIPKKIIYVKCSNPEKYNDINYDENIIMINPKIIEAKGETYFWEACASCLDNTCYVKRPYSIKIEYYDITGNKNVKELNGFISTVISHEYDHLFGILHMDKSEKTLHLTKEEKENLRQKEPYLIISKK